MLPEDIVTFVRGSPRNAHPFLASLTSSLPFRLPSNRIRERTALLRDHATVELVSRFLRRAVFWTSYHIRNELRGSNFAIAFRKLYYSAQDCAAAQRNRGRKYKPRKINSDPCGFEMVTRFGSLWKEANRAKILNNQ